MISDTHYHLEGSAVMWTARVIKALLDLEPQVTYWPPAAEREEIAKAFDAEFEVIGGCVGMIDGFHVVLYQRPGRDDGADFFNRKGSYSFNILGVCDHRRRLRHISVGNVGRTGDNPIWTISKPYQEPERHFTNSQYLLGDSAFVPSDHIVAMFPRSAKSELSVEERKFNHHMATGRSEIEHTFGMLKGRFSSLRGLRASITNKRDEAKVGGWIRACVVLHNLLIDNGEDFSEYVPEPTLPEEPYGLAPRGKEMASRHHPLRRSIMMSMGLGEPGGPRWVASHRH